MPAPYEWDGFQTPPSPGLGKGLEARSDKGDIPWIPSSLGLPCEGGASTKPVTPRAPSTSGRRASDLSLSSVPKAFVGSAQEVGINCAGTAASVNVDRKETSLPFEFGTKEFLDSDLLADAIVELASTLFQEFDEFLYEKSAVQRPAAVFPVRYSATVVACVEMLDNFATRNLSLAPATASNNNAVQGISTRHKGF